MKNKFLKRARESISSDIAALKRFARVTAFPISSIAGLLALRFFSLVFEGIGVGMILPIVEFIGNDGNVEQFRESSPIWKVLLDFFDAIYLPVNLLTLMLIVLVSVIVRQVFQYAYNAWNIRGQHLYTKDVQNLLFRYALGLKMEKVEGIPKGDLVNILVIEAGRAAATLWAIIPFCSSLILLVAYMVSLVLISVPMSGILVIALAINLLTLLGLMRKTATAGRNVAFGNQEISNFLIRRLGHLRQTRLSGFEKQEADTYLDVITRFHINMGEVKVLKSSIPLLMQPMAVITLLAFLYLGNEVIGVPIAHLILFCGIIVRLVPVLQALATSVQGYFSIRVSFRVAYDFLTFCEEHQEVRTGKIALPHFREEIRFQDVGYTYPSGEGVALADVNLSFPAHKWTAVVGPSGAGKSTLIDLIPALRMPTNGNVIIEGISTTDLGFEELREKIAYVSQSPQLTSGTILDHLSYGRPALKMEDIEAAADQAGLWDFVEGGVEGLSRPLGEEGGFLSGGQRQRIELARALAMNAEVIIMDEPTTGLDPVAARQLSNVLSNIVRTKNKTVVTITHDLSSTQYADQIVVLNNGQVEAEGDYETMLKESVWFRLASDRSKEPQTSSDTPITPL